MKNHNRKSTGVVININDVCAIMYSIPVSQHSQYHGHTSGTPEENIVVINYFCAFLAVTCQNVT